MTLTTLERTPPHNLEMEEAVLGACLISQEAVGEAVEQVLPEHFYHTGYGLIYEAILYLFNEGQGIDPLTVGQHLQEMGKLELCGGPLVLAKLAGAVATWRNISYHLSTVKDLSQKRTMMVLGNKIYEAAGSQEGTVDDLLSRTDEALARLHQGHGKKGFESIAVLTGQLQEEVEAAHSEGRTLLGLDSGHPLLNHYMSGLQRSDYSILGGRPSSGKTSFGLQLAKQVALRNPRAVIGVLSLEMSSLSLMVRLISTEARVPMYQIRLGKMNQEEWEDYAAACQKIFPLAIHIDDTPGLSISEAKAKSRKLKQGEGLDLLIVDYLQLMSSSGHNNREQEVGSISRGMKGIAKELDCHVLALSQLSRAPEGRGAGRPQLSDLRDSGCLAGDTLVSLADGSLACIEELVGFQPQLVTVEGHRLVTQTARKVWQTGVRPTFKMTLDSGRQIVATANHRFLQWEGYTALDQLSPGDKVATSDLYWDSISAIDPGEVIPVFDIEVPQTHNFVANGTVVHNSLEQDADNVCFLYAPHRSGVKGPDGESMEGIVELIIAKQRNGPLENILYRFDANYVTFTELTREQQQRYS
jgi:replicative DNA helicase